jgi:pentatricopeptide repeat protein
MRTSIQNAGAKGELAEQASQLFETMRSQRLVPEVFTYISLIDACAKGELVDRHRSSSRRSGPAAHARSVHLQFVDQCVREERVGRADIAALRDDSVAACYAQSVPLLLIDRYLREGRACRAGIAAPRDDAVAAAHARVFTYTSLINACAKGELAEQASQLFETSRTTVARWVVPPPRREHVRHVAALRSAPAFGAMTTASTKTAARTTVAR